VNVFIYDIGNESVPKIMHVINDTINVFFLNCNQHFGNFKFSECCLAKLLPRILFEKCIYILALEMAGIVPIVSAV